MTQIPPRADLTTTFKEDGNIADSTTNPTYTLFDLEKKVIESLNDFNKKYAVYLRCSDGIYNVSETNFNVKYDNKKGCEGESSNKQVNTDKVKTAYNTVMQRADAFNNALSKINMNENGITPAQYEERYSAIVSKYSEIVKLQNDISWKIQDIKAVENPNKNKGTSYIHDAVDKYNATMYSTLMLTVLATSIVYYAFVKL
jgi:hypothetical protein